jgi:hypothetical protein
MRNKVPVPTVMAINVMIGMVFRAHSNSAVLHPNFRYYEKVLERAGGQVESRQVKQQFFQTVVIMNIVGFIQLDHRK